MKILPWILPFVLQKDKINNPLGLLDLSKEESAIGPGSTGSSGSDSKNISSAAQRVLNANAKLDVENKKNKKF